MSQHIFDYAIIGSGLGGLATAVRLGQETKNVVLLDAAEQAGGLNRLINFPTGPINNGIRHVADTPSTRAALGFLEDLLGLKLGRAPDEVPPVTFEDGQLREFLGFGDKSPAFYDQLAPFMNPRRIELALEPYAWTPLLMEKFAGTFMPKSYVTKIVVEDGRATQLVLNGSKTIRAANVIYTGPVKPLAAIVPADALGSKLRQKLAKTSAWTALCLDLCHAKPVTDSAAVHILNGTTQDDIGPCAGKFLPTVETEKGTLQASQWTTFLDEEVTEESEVIAHALKKIKRQIKRAYPDALEGLIRERIMVAPMIGGADVKFNADQTLGEIPNLWIGSGSLSAERGTLAPVQQARLVLASLGFGSIETPAEPAAEAEAAPEPPAAGI